MGKPNEKGTQINVRIPDELAERLKNLAWGTGKKLTVIVCEGILTEVKKLEREWKKTGKELPQRPTGK